jgi:squalene cyclase
MNPKPRPRHPGGKPERVGPGRAAWTAAIALALVVPAIAVVRAAPGDADADADAKARAAPDTDRARVKAAVERAIAPLQKSLTVYAEKRDCFSCHHQGITLVALEIAGSRGLTIDEDAVAGAVTLTLDDLATARVDYRKGQGQPGGVTRAAYALWTLEAGAHPADEMTAAVVEYLLKADRDRDHWTTSSRRPPMENSHFTTTALALRGLAYYGSKSQTEAAKERSRHARAWLAKSRPADTEDRVFRLWGLKYSGASPAELDVATKDLQTAQRDDGGWSQTDKLASDAYATGSALVALHQAGGVKTDDPSYRRGVAFLLSTQKPDGTWFVASRSHAFQPYFESGFPYGKDQFIAAAATGWSAAALALTLPPKP